MATDPGRWLLAAGAIALGFGMIAWPWVPAPAPNPLPAAFDAGTPAGRQLLSVLQWHDHSCQQGDVAAFRDHVTAGYTASFARRLNQLGRALDGAALRDYVGVDGRGGLAPMFGAGAGGHADGARACLVAAAPLPQRGVRAVAFVWDGAVFRLDAVEQQPSVDPADAAAVAAMVLRLLAP